MDRFTEIINGTPEEEKRSKLWVWIREEFTNEELYTLRKFALRENDEEIENEARENPELPIRFVALMIDYLQVGIDDKGRSLVREPETEEEKYFLNLAMPILA